MWSSLLQVTMKVAGRNKLADFVGKHSDARSPIDAWVREALAAEWRTPKQVKERYAHASIIGNDRVVFNIKGNRYRLDVQINYETLTILIKRVGTHEEYNSWKF